MLQVFETTEEREKAKNELCCSTSMNLKCFPSGITPPTHKIIERKFSKTRRQKSHPVNIFSSINHLRFNFYFS